MNKQRYVVIDLETTGNAPKKGDKIIQIAAIIIENGQIMSKYMSFVNPLQKIPPFIEQLTGISNEMVDEAPTFDEIADELQSLLANSTFVAHNVYFDLSFLQEELATCGFQFSGPILDTVELSRIAFPTNNSYKLSDLSDDFNLQHDNPHRADSDAEVTAHLLLAIFEKIKALPLTTLQQLLSLSRSFISDIEELLQEFIAEKLVNIKNQSNRKDLEIVRSLAIKQRQDNVSPIQSGQEAKVDLDEILSIFEEDLEIIHEILPKYRVREQQIQMMKEIYESFSSHQHELIEAATGSGKTVAYLVPALLFSIREQKPILISTYTTNLQAQIMEQDIPFLKKVLPFPFSATILKGQRHYLCLQKFEQSLNEIEDNYDFILTKSQILIWLTETFTGDLDELNIPSGGKALWNQLHVDKSSFMNNPFSSYCFYQRAKEKAIHANLIITNHALLLGDIIREQKILPHYQEVIIDEAHHFHTVASEQLGMRLSYLHIHNLINQLGTTQSKGNLQKFTEIKEFNIEHQHLLEMDRCMIELQDECHQFFSAIHSYVLIRRKDTSANRISYRFDSEQENNRAWSAILELSKRIIFLLSDVIRLMDKSLQMIGKVNEESLSIKSKIVYENFKSYLVKIREFKRSINDLFFANSETSVTWIEIDAKGAKNAASIYAQPLQISDFLADEYFAKMQSAILTSATLSVKQSFSYMIDVLGLTDFYPKQLQLQSSFNYKEQVKLFIPSDMPLVNEVSIDEYSEAIAANIGSVAQITDGKILALFTSYEMLKKTYQLLKEDDTLEDFMILGQGTGSGSRLRLTKNFKQFEKAILLGTSSFWEGVDFPGEELTALMIVRLPFAAPENPIVAAKSSQLEVVGKNAFYEYSLPEAILRFKQGFGRLIRNEEDRGILFVLDNRIVTAKYGKDFLMSIPNLDIEKNPMHILTHSIEKWVKK